MILPNNHVSDGLAPNFDSEPFTIISDGILRGLFFKEFWYAVKKSLCDA